jgi:hypothetical protein
VAQTATDTATSPKTARRTTKSERQQSTSNRFRFVSPPLISRTFQSPNDVGTSDNFVAFLLTGKQLLTSRPHVVIGPYISPAWLPVRRNATRSVSEPVLIVVRTLKGLDD